jgi:DNA (cytosine-5)-methyltransferase 1
MIPDESLPGFPIWADQFNVKPEITKDCPDWKKNFLIKNSEFYLKHKALIDAWKSMRWGVSQKTISEFPRSRQLFEWQAKKAQPRKSDRSLKKLVLQFRPSGIRVKPPTYLPALVAITQTSIVGPGVHPEVKEYRELSPGEAAVLQGMPPDFYLGAGIDEKQAYKQLGNAVNVGVIRYLANRLIKGHCPENLGQLKFNI